MWSREPETTVLSLSLFQSSFGIFRLLLIFLICSRLDFAADVMFYMHVNSASAALTSIVVVLLRKLNVRVFVVMSIMHKCPLCLDTDSLASVAPGR